MTLPAPKPLAVSTSPNAGPAAARVAAQDAQIAQLVQQVRTLEHTIGQQRTQLDAEKARGMAAVNQIREQWRAESKDWRDGCDALQSRHRLAHLGTRMALEHERCARFEDKEALVREKIARLLREHRITLFQARETEILSQLAALEDEVEARRDEHVRVVAQHEEEITFLTAKLEKSDIIRQEKNEELGGFERDKRTLEAEVATLRSTVTSNGKQIDRLTLQVDTFRTQKTTLEERNKELQHQVDKWQTLENKGDKEVTELRKRRMELEVRVKELEVSLKESRNLDKKVARLETSLLETQEQVEQGNQEITEAQKEAARARRQVAKLERQVAKLQAALAAEKTRSANEIDQIRSQSSSNKSRRNVPSAVTEVPDHSDDEPHRPRNKDNSRNEEKAQEIIYQTEGEEEDDVHDVKMLEVRAKHSPPQSDSEIEEIPSPKKKNSQPVPASPRHPPANGPEAARKPRSRTGNARTDENHEEDGGREARPKKRARSKPLSVSSDQNSKKQVEMTTDAEDEDEQVQKKKKRKLNLAGGSVFPGPASFTWDQVGGDGLGIPSVLSPIKEDQPVPPRSGSQSLLGNWKLWK